PDRQEEAGREHAQGRRRARDAPGVRVLARPPSQLAALLPTLPVMVLVGWWFGPVGVAAAVAASVAGLAVLVAWVEGLGEDADSTAPVTPGAVLGGGDVKMMALVGSFTGPWGAVLTVFLAALAGLLAYLKLRMLLGTRHLVPLGVFLAVGAAITLWWGQALLDWYLRLSGLT
ncbi:MAG: hypothetical protein F4Z78_03965, partial [Gammaproteobacteria bacterium]|nr:hypothetical protein [Gammaproteobacteria bacterium]